MKRDQLRDLFLTFAQIGLFTFGGGYAMISMIEHSCVEEKYKQVGMAGALAATFGIVVPPFLVILAVSLFLYDFFTWKLLAAAFQGIKIAVGLLILEAAMMMLRKGSRTRLSRGILLGSCLAMLCSDIFRLPISSIRLMLLAAGVSLVSSRLQAPSHQESGGRK